ncbi:MAG: histidine phosphatase family protein [Cyanobacteria bacterium RU_5_0]|nr:histidine phosphatase family protein [Cyanobacteria bacterium RU_5_0]
MQWHNHTRVVLVRHGRSTFNEQGRYQGSSDESVLTEAGQIAARQVGKFLQGTKIDVIYASPLRRVQETVHELLVGIGTTDLASIHLVEHLREIDLPAWEGLTFKQVREQFADDYRCWKQYPHQFQMEAADQTFGLAIGNSSAVAALKTRCFPVLDLYDRVKQFWQNILPQHVGQTLLIVGHGGTNHALISTALGLSPAQHHIIQQSNCGISVLNFASGFDDFAQLQALNLTGHLGETLPKLKEGKHGLRLLLLPSNDLSSEQTEQLAKWLKEVTIDFSLSADLDSLNQSQNTAEKILRFHPTTVQLQVYREDFSQVWLNTITHKCLDSNQLITGLLIAPKQSIQDILGRVLSLNSEQIWRLPLQPGTFSVLHYPSVEHPPILQALNIHSID